MADLDQQCYWCDELIAVGEITIMVPHFDESGSGEHPWHRNCFLRSILGSVGHQKRLCSCFGGTQEDPDGMTRKQAADAAAELWRAGR